VGSCLPPTRICRVRGQWAGGKPARLRTPGVPIWADFAAAVQSAVPFDDRAPLCPRRVDRRFPVRPMSPRRFRFNDFELDALARELRSGGDVVALPLKSFECLVYLLEHRERAVGRDEL